MDKGRLKIGRFFYSNLFPLFYALEKKSDCSRYEFVEGVPSELNRKIHEGLIDVSPSSSIEYLRHPDSYHLIENHSISSYGPVGSIFLFSKRPIDALEGVTILTSSQSETSVVLLMIILKKFIGLKKNIRIVSSSETLAGAMEREEAYMLIGDDALAEALKWPDFHRYDLGELWYRHAGLPMTFALWIARKECLTEKGDLLRRFKIDLDNAKSFALSSLDTIAKTSPLRGLLSAEELVRYWQGISYDLGPDHMEGLGLFRKYAAELRLL